MITTFADLTDEQLAKHIQAAIAELKDRHAKQEKELAKAHGQQMAAALGPTATKKRGRKSGGKTNDLAA